MAALSLATVLALAASCQSVVAPVTIAGMAQHESGLDPRAVHHNADGSTDLGLMQINSRNVRFLGLTDPFDPCQSIAAASRLLASFSRYNTGNSVKGIANGYATAVAASIRGVKAAGDGRPVKAQSADPPASSIFARPNAGSALILATNSKG